MSGTGTPEDPLVGVVLPAPDPVKFAHAIVETLTAADFRDLPDYLADALVEWSDVFCRWADVQTVPPGFQGGKDEFIPGWVYDVGARGWVPAWR